MKKTLSKVLAVVIAMVLVFSTTPVAFAADSDIASGTAGEGVNWVLDADGTLTISGEGEIEVDWYSPPWYDYNDYIINIVVEEGITKIPSTAFCYAENLLTVSIPASVTDMPINDTPIFWGSGFSLKEVNVHQDNPAFTSVDGIVFSKDKTMLYLYPMSKEGDSYTVPDTVTTVNSYAFGFNETLKSVTIPDTVNELGEDAFYNANVESVTIGNGIKTIPDSCFTYCYCLESIVLSESIETIEREAFWACSGLKNITIGVGIKTVYEDAFGYCDLLSAIHYLGTEEQWAEVVIEEDEEDYLSNIAIHYSTDVHFKEATAADCTTDGHTAGDYCDVCEDYLTGDVLEEALGHDFVNGVCQREDCGYVCTHTVNDVFDNKCDDCGEEIALDITDITLGENSVYIEKGKSDVYAKFVPKESGQYVLRSDNGGDFDAIDPYAYVYDNAYNELNYDDDGGESYNFELVFDADAGDTYYFVLGSYDSNVEYTYILEKHIAIDHQPTSSRPYVELTWDVDATYQWYKYEEGFGEITDIAAEPFLMSDKPAFYDSENGWTGYYDNNDSSAQFFYIHLAEGESITVEATGNVSEIFIYNPEVSDYTQSAGPDENGKVTLTSVYDMSYILAAHCDADATVRAYGNTTIATEIKGQTTNTLTDAVIGESYACKVTVGEEVMQSDVFVNSYAITHEPTEQEPYVETNDPSAKYQWQSVKYKDAEITDQSQVITEVDGMVLGTYDAENGWSGMRASDEAIVYFVAEFYVGDTVIITASDDAQGVVLLDLNSLMSDELKVLDATFSSDKTAVLNIPANSVYMLALASTTDTTIRVVAPTYVYEPIKNKTDAKFTPQEIGSYACEVTFTDGSTEMSRTINKRYNDVPFGQWYSQAIEYTSVFGIMTGYGGTNNFGTADNIQRQDFLVLLARFDGVDLDEYGDRQSAFPDVPEDSYYEAAVNWGAENGIVSGYENGKFGVGDKITREQLITFLYRYANYKGIDTSCTAAQKNAVKNTYTDYKYVTDYAQDAVVWAVTNNVINGKTPTTIVPGGNALRCETAQIMYNIFLNNVFN